MQPEIPAERFEIYATAIDHPECVAFDRSGDLWCGGEAGQIYRIDSARNVHEICRLGGFTGGIAFSPDDGLIACNPSLGLVKVDRSGKHHVFADRAAGHKILTPNFAVYDSAGNLYLTDSGAFRKNNGYLLRFDPAGNGQVIAGPLGYANGLALSLDEKWLWMVESDQNRVLRFELAEGKVVAQTIYATETGWLPDGLALDDAGNLYVSCYASDDIFKIAPNGTKIRFAHDPFAILLSRPTNMAFDGNWMYVANLGRTTITRAKLDVRGMDLVNRRKPPNR
jgi:gluconolactonase